MPKRIALKDSVNINSVDLSNFSRSVSFSSEHERVDVSGFNPAGSNEFLAGATTQEFTVEFYGAYGTGETHQTLYPLHQARTIFPIKWRPDGSTPISVSNPELRGNAQLLTYGPSATRGEEDAWEATFTTADPAGFAYVTVGP